MLKLLRRLKNELIRLDRFSTRGYVEDLVDKAFYKGLHIATNTLSDHTGFDTVNCFDIVREHETCKKRYSV